MKEDGAACWERGQPAAGQEQGDVLQGFVKQMQLTAPEAAQLCSALSHNSKKQVKMISNEQFCQKHYADQYDIDLAQCFHPNGPLSS